MKLALALLATVSLNAFAKDLTSECKKELSQQMIALENKYLDGIGAKLTQPEVHIWANENKGKVSVGGWVEDTTDGRSVRYGDKTVTVREFETCDIQLERDNSSQCRFSADGDDELTEKLGWKLTHEVTITPTTKLYPIEKQQVMYFLDDSMTYDETKIPELIKSTDDGSISKANYTLKNGVEVTYFKAYGGDNPYGTFYLTGTTTHVGSNGDGDICIGYAVEQ